MTRGRSFPCQPSISRTRNIYSLWAFINEKHYGSTDAELRTYLSTFYFPAATSLQMDKLLELYPQDPAQGSPFGTGDLNALTPQFKRMASLQGDFIFQANRRFFLYHRSSKQNTWVYCKRISL